jgi:hypothetical protein
VYLIEEPGVGAISICLGMYVHLYSVYIRLPYVEVGD